MIHYKQAKLETLPAEVNHFTTIYSSLNFCNLFYFLGKFENLRFKVSFAKIAAPERF